MFLTPIDYNKQIENKIAKIVSDFFHAELFKPIEDIIKVSNKVYNAQTSDLQNAIIKGQIYYQNNAFYSRSGRFSNKIAKELESIGAKYSKFRKAYVIEHYKLNADILWAVETEATRTKMTVEAILDLLLVKQAELPKLADNLIFGEIINQMFLDLQNKLYADAKKHKIALISPKLDDFRLQEIHKNYVDNLHFWIKSFTETETVKMRQDLLQLVLDGKSTKTIAEYIQKRYGVNKRKALFLARNENAIATSSYLIAQYKNNGFKYYRWNDSHDERVRELHRELGKKENNKYGINGSNIFEFDNPPVIYQQEKNGVIVKQERGNAGQTYNCRCTMSPYVDKDLFNRLHELYNRQNQKVKL